MSKTAPAFRRLPPAERREQILQTATDVIAGAGFKGVPLEAFATAAGMTKAGLLHHFPSKDELLIAVLERRDREDLTQVLISTALPLADAKSARDAFTALVHRNVGQPALIRLYTVLSAEALDPAHPAHSYFAHRLEHARSELAQLAFAWHPTPDRAAVQALSFLDGVQLNWLRDPAIDVAEHWEVFADTLFGIRPPTSRASRAGRAQPSAKA